MHGTLCEIYCAFESMNQNQKQAQKDIFSCDVSEVRSSQRSLNVGLTLHECKHTNPHLLLPINHS